MIGLITARSHYPLHSLRLLWRHSSQIMRGQAHVVLNISPILKPTCMETSLSGIACLLVIRQGVTVVMTGGWDTVKLPISANNYFAIASPVTPTTNYWGDGANVPVSVQSVKTNSIIIALPGGRNQWKASILIIGTV